MRKCLSVIMILAMFFILYIFQTNFLNWFTIANVMANIFLPFIIVIIVFTSKKFAFFCSLLLGLLLDILTGPAIGINAIIFVVFAHFLGDVKRYFIYDNRFIFLVTTIIITFLYNALFILLQIVLNDWSFILLDFLYKTVIQIVYNCMLLIVFYVFWIKLGNFLKESLD